MVDLSKDVFIREDICEYEIPTNKLKAMRFYLSGGSSSDYFNMDFANTEWKKWRIKFSKETQSFTIWNLVDNISYVIPDNQIVMAVYEWLKEEKTDK